MMATDVAGPRPAQPGSSSPPAEATFLLRVSAIWAALSMPIARIVAPGLRGNARDTVVVLVHLMAAAASYALAFLLGAVTLEGASRLLRSRTQSRLRAHVMVVGAFVTLVLVVFAFARRLPSPFAIALVLVSGTVSMLAAATALSRPATRAVGFVLALFGMAALVRLFGWQIATAAGEQGSTRLYEASRVIASGGVVLEAVGQLAAVAWLGTRRRGLGQILTSIAIVAGFALTWGATLGAAPGAAVWQAVLHTALLQAPGVPAPYGLAAVATFLLAASFPLAIVATLQRAEDARAASALALVLVSHGTFDAPLRALAAVAASMTLMTLSGAPSFGAARESAGRPSG